MKAEHPSCINLCDYQITERQEPGTTSVCFNYWLKCPLAGQRHEQQTYIRKHKLIMVVRCKGEVGAKIPSVKKTYHSSGQQFEKNVLDTYTYIFAFVRNLSPCMQY